MTSQHTPSLGLETGSPVRTTMSLVFDITIQVVETRQSQADLPCQALNPRSP